MYKPQRIMKKLERLNGELFKQLNDYELTHYHKIYGGESTGVDKDTKVSDNCDVWGEKGDKGCVWDNSTQADRINTTCENDTPITIGPTDVYLTIDTANIDYAGII
jgi:hypothetical protein